MVPGLAPALGIRCRQEGVDGVALTFDDGPHPEGTPLVLEILREAAAPATFFLAGEQVVRRPALAAEIVAAGHRVELHCYRHRNLLRLTTRQFLDDAERARAAIEEASGQAIADYRPPYGIFSATALRAMRGGAAGGRCSGRSGGGTGPAARLRSRSRAARSPPLAAATSSSCTTPTTTAPRAPGPVRRRLCRSSSRSWTAAG